VKAVQESVATLNHKIWAPITGMIPGTLLHASETTPIHPFTGENTCKTTYPLVASTRWSSDRKVRQEVRQRDKTSRALGYLLRCQLRIPEQFTSFKIQGLY
jgi:hypothetical protein